MSIASVIRERRSIKKGYKPDPVSEELILELLNDAVYAPNHGLREPWRFLYVPTEKKEDFIERMMTAFAADQQETRRALFSEPSAFLIVIMKEDPRQKHWEEDFCATSAMIQNFQLLAWEKDLGVVWKTNPHNFDPKVHQILGVQPGEKIVAFLHLGFFYRAEAPQAAPRTPAEQKFTRFS